MLILAMACDLAEPRCTATLADKLGVRGTLGGDTDRIGDPN